MSQQIVASIRAKYLTPLGAGHPAFLLEVASTLHLGLLKKDIGTFVRLPDGVGVAQDIVMASDGRSWDILVDGENTAKPVFNVSDVQDLSRYYAVGAAPPGPTPPPPTPPPPVPGTPAFDVKAELVRLAAAIEANAESLRVNDAANERQYLDLVQKIKHIVGPDYEGSVKMPFLGTGDVKLTPKP